MEKNKNKKSADGFTNGDKLLIAIILIFTIPGIGACIVRGEFAVMFMAIFLIATALYTLSRKRKNNK